MILNKMLDDGAPDDADAQRWAPYRTPDVDEQLAEADRMMVPQFNRMLRGDRWQPFYDDQQAYTPRTPTLTPKQLMIMRALRSGEAGL